MKKIIRSIAERLGVATGYHVAAYSSYLGEQRTGSMTVQMTPWLHADNYAELIDYIKEAQGHKQPPSITSITKLGL